MSERVPDVPILVVVSGPSGAGKSTLVDMYVEKHPETSLVVSVTTRTVCVLPTSPAGRHLILPQ